MNILMDEITSQTLKKLEATQKKYWNVPQKTGLLLNTFIKMMNIKNVLEIGTSNGYSGLWMAKALAKTKGKLTTIEFYETRQHEAIENFKKCGVIDIVNSLQGNAIHIIERFEQNELFDMVFIDANKKEYLNYFKLIKPHLTTKALLIADNVISHEQKVKPFVEALSKDSDFQYEILEMPGGLLVAYKE